MVRRQIDTGSYILIGVSAPTLVKLLLARARSGDLNEARDTVAELERELAAMPIPGYHLFVLCCHLLLAKAASDRIRYTAVLADYYDLAQRLAASGHMDTAQRLMAELAAGG